MVGGSLLLAVAKADPPHKHEEEEFMVIAEGTAEILVDGKTVKVPASARSAAGIFVQITRKGLSPLPKASRPGCTG